MTELNDIDNSREQRLEKQKEKLKLYAARKERINRKIGLRGKLSLGLGAVGAAVGGACGLGALTGVGAVVGGTGGFFVG